MRKLILASQSPRRKELLEKCGIPFETEPADIDETLSAEGTLEEQIRILSRRKAEAVLKLHPEAVVLGSDTIVAVNGEILGKPADAEEAARMIRMIQGREHEVFTGVCLIALCPGEDGKPGLRTAEIRNFSEGTKVHVVPMTEREIRDYVACGESLDKAGAYAIQGEFGKYIDRFEGDYENVIGLPVKRVLSEIRSMTEEE